MAKAIDMLLLDGTPDGPKTATIRNWPGKAIFCPVEKAGQILKRKEFERPGVYILKSAPKTSSFNERIYIGESDVLLKRLKSHISRIAKKPFDSFVAFTSTDSLLDKATVKYLEHKLIGIAQRNKSSEVGNRVAPKAPYLSEANIYSMDAFLVEMKILLPLMGFEFQNPTTLNKEDAPIEIDKEESDELQLTQDLYSLKASDTSAFMYVSEGKFIVTKGSQMKKKESKTIGSSWVRLRRRLVKEGMAIDDGQHYKLTQDVIFNSPSAASSTILGRQTAGPRMWMHIEKQITYGQLLQEELAAGD